MRWINVHQETYISQLKPDSYSNIAGSAKPLQHSQMSFELLFQNNVFQIKYQILYLEYVFKLTNSNISYTYAVFPFPRYLVNFYLKINI